MAAHNLALSTFLQGSPWRAYKIEQDVYETWRRLIGPGEMRVWRSYCDMGSYLREQGQPQQAIELLSEALVQIRQVPGRDTVHHVDVLRIRRQLAITARWLGDPKLSQAEAVWRDYSKVLGEEHPDTRASRLSYAAACFTSGYLSEAVGAAVACLRGYGELPEPEHPFLAVCRVNLAGYRRAEGETGTALKLSRSGHDALLRRLGARHPWRLAALINLAVCEASNDRRDEAERLLEQAVPLCRQTLTTTHPWTVAAHANLTLLRTPDDGAPRGTAANDGSQWRTLDIDLPQT
jgi:tetratricopeptide (TPR) repeat protein